jgi:hypothetical protein
LKTGLVTGGQRTPDGPWHLRIINELRQKIVPDVPDGWLPVDQAAKTLGIARQIVLREVQRSGLSAVHVTTGKREGLRTPATTDTPGLLATTR